VDFRIASPVTATDARINPVQKNGSHNAVDVIASSNLYQIQKMSIGYRTIMVQLFAFAITPK